MSRIDADSEVAVYRADSVRSAVLADSEDSKREDSASES